MEKIIAVFAIIVVVFFCFGYMGNQADNMMAEDIVKAKSYVRSMCNHPETIQFHDMETVVTETHISLVFSAANSFGVREKHHYTGRRDAIRNIKLEH